ncbi:hypothetical protein H8D79_01090 [PVC group bacterium]|nr:hypothetical protein [PVC group bacterium]
MPEPLHLRFDGERRIDLDALESAVSGRALRDWICDRCMGTDKRLHLDDDSLETADEVLIDIWIRADPASKTRECLDWACQSLLQEAWEAEPDEWMEPLLDLVAAARPVACAAFLKSIVQQGSFRKKPDGWDERWLETAAAYGAGDIAHTWAHLLDEPDYVVTAYWALSRNVPTGVKYLRAYYCALPNEERGWLLKEALADLLQMDVDAAVNGLRGIRERMETAPGLCEAIDEAIRELGRPPVYGQVATPYLRGAATPERRSRELLPDAAG